MTISDKIDLITWVYFEATEKELTTVDAESILDEYGIRIILPDELKKTRNSAYNYLIK